MKFFGEINSVFLYPVYTLTSLFLKSKKQIVQILMRERWLHRYLQLDFMQCNRYSDHLANTQNCDRNAYQCTKNTVQNR